MTRTTCIDHLPGQSMLIIREDYMAVCTDSPDSACAAALLNDLEYWTNKKIASSQQAKTHNDIREAGGLDRTQDESLWIWKSTGEFQADLMGIWGETKITACRKWLVDNGYVHQRQNPNYSWDKKYQYLLDIEALNSALRCLKTATFDALKLRLREPGNTPAIPETTSEITTETTTENQPQPRPHPVVVVDPVPPIPETVKTVFGEKRALGIIDEIKLRHGVATDYTRLAALCQSALDNPAVRSKGGWVIDAVAGDWRIDAPARHDNDPYGYAKYTKWDTPDDDPVGTAFLPSSSNDDTPVGTHGCASAPDDAPNLDDGELEGGKRAGGEVHPTPRVHLPQPLGDQTLSAREIWDRACTQLVDDYGCLFEPVLRALTLVDFDPAIRQFTAVFRSRSDRNLDFQTTHGAIRQVLMRLCGTRDIQLRFAPHFRWPPPQFTPVCSRAVYYPNIGLCL